MAARKWTGKQYVSILIDSSKMCAALLLVLLNRRPTSPELDLFEETHGKVGFQ